MRNGLADELYGLPLSDFIPERDARVKALRADKKRDEATAVAGLRKPSMVAWSVNQLVRTQGKAITALFKAGDAIAKAQAAGKADALREASRGQRDAIDELMRAAEGLLSSEGHPLTPATLERVRETLRVASIDQTSREQVAGGCLTQELRFAGLGIGELPAAAPERPARLKRPDGPEPPAKKAKPKQPDTEAERERKAEEKREREAARERKSALTGALKAETEARKAATRAERELSAATKKHEQAEAAFKQADERLSAATKWSDQTAEDLEQAARAVRDLAGD